MPDRIKTVSGLLAVVSVVFICREGSAENVVRAGRDLPVERNVNWRVSVGHISEMQGLVEETTRSYYDVTGQQLKLGLAENYDLNDFGMDGGYGTIGLSYEKAGKFLSFQFDVSVMNPEIDTVARRNYYIGVGEDVEFQGRGYDNMLIPEGTPFSMELIGGFMEMRGLITPFTFKPSEMLRITPWLDLGLFVFAGQYEVDAGEPTGTTQYLIPPEEFVIGGSSEGTVGLGLPEVGFGGEIRIGDESGANLVLSGHYVVCEYDGSSKYLTTSSHREKDIEIDHVNYRLRCTYEVPMENSRCFTLGVQYQVIDTEAMIQSTAATAAEIIARRERFDKSVQFELEAVTGMIGLTF